MRRPAFAFQPFSKRQKQAITWWMAQSPYADYDGIVADGAVRSGKTVAMIVGFVLWSTGCFAGENFIVSGKSIGTLKRNVVAPMCQILQALGIAYQYHRAENYLEFCGNTYYLFGANNEASQDVLQGLTAAGWLGDEVALHPQNFIEQAIARCSVEGAKFWLNCNPENPYHYVKTELID
jgi:PBSX family phage terminase large subunit